MELIKEEVVRRVISDAEKTFITCFNMLLNNKHATENMGDSILRFQPLLAECLYNTMELYRKLHSEKEYIISQKNDLNEYDFYNATKTNSKHLNVVKETIEIGKSLGDAFVWFFYSRNQAELSFMLLLRGRCTMRGISSIDL